MIKVAMRSNPQMESIMTLVAEWFSHGELMVPQGVSVLMSDYVREWQYEDILNDIDNQAWENLSEEWHTHTSEGGEKSCFVKLATSLQVRTRAHNQNKVRDGDPWQGPFGKTSSRMLDCHRSPK